MIKTTTHVCKASEAACSGTASCWCRCGPSWYCSPACCSDSSDSPDRCLWQRRCCRCTCRPCSVCLHSAGSQWTDAPTAHVHISPSARNLSEEVKQWQTFKSWDDVRSFPHILPWIERLGTTLITVSDHYLWIDFIITKAWHLSDRPPVRSP